MSCLENINIPSCIWFQGEEKRNAIASLIAGLLFFTGWWIIIDVNVTYDKFNGAYHLCGIFATISLVISMRLYEDMRVQFHMGAAYYCFTISDMRGGGSLGISLVRVNCVSNAALSGSGYDGGCLGQQGARIWLFIGFLIGFASIIAACWILFADFVAKNTAENPIPQWAGSGLFLQNCFIFIASLIYKFGRTEEQSW